MIYPDKSLGKISSKFKAYNALSYADFIAAATAAASGPALVTGDKEFQRLGKEVIIDWL